MSATPPAPALAGGGLAVLVGRRAVLLTENAPVTVINTSLTDQIYLAADSNVSPATGVPVAPSTSYQWQTPGTLYAIADQAITDAGAAVVLTGSSDAWQPSPVAIGAAIGAQLAAQGIVTSRRITFLGQWRVPAHFHATIDTATLGYPALGSFGSLYVSALSAGGAAPQPLPYQWQAIPDGAFIGPADLLVFSQDGFSTTATIPVGGTAVRFDNFNSADVTLTLYGVNEQVSDKPIGNGFSQAGFIAGTSYAVGDTGSKVMAVTAGQMFQGPAQCYLTINYAASKALDALYIRLNMMGIPIDYNIIGPGQLMTVNAGRYEASFSRAFPAAPFALKLVTGITATVAFTVSFEAIPLQ